ncbi:protein-tyrosine phosphatase-like protein [Panaeolus papilionaceus]|nr:protein-tyrosine phosphatase-like protein [Panaeolus papilionaceus]
MDAIRVPKVEQVLFSKGALVSHGTLHLTAHHIIFRYDEPVSDETEMWLTFHTRTFESFSFTFKKDSDATDVFESVKELTVATSVTQLYAFFYNPNPPLPTNEGWSIYSPREEYGRMGVGTRSKAWRFTDLNKEYTFCPTYPARLVVPTRISDTTLQYASKYRSKCRIPILSYLHWGNYGSITRSSQPMVGITQNRSIQDEKLIEAIFQSHWSPETRAASAPVYGATTTNLIIDARPTVNAVANTAKGAGTENMDYYKDSKKIYLGIDHIHTMRESLAKVVEALRDADQLLASIKTDLQDQVSDLTVLDRPALRRSGWLRHLSAILEGTIIITKNVHINSSHVLIHCSDGWDRTSQLSALSQVCLDPFYRTIRGFEILMEKDWLSFGHKFLDRSGHLSSEKFFVSPTGDISSGSGTEAAQAFLVSVQNRFASQNHLKETSPIFHQFLESVRQVQRQFPDRFEFNERFLRKIYYHLYSCQFGTFLFNCERERKTSDDGPPAVERTRSLWDFLNTPAEMEQNRNPTYDPSLDDPSSRAVDADMGVLYPNAKDVRFWNELYGRADEEMNGRAVPIPKDAELVGPVSSAEDDVIIQGPTTPQRIGSPTSAITQSLNLPPVSNARSPSPGILGNLRDLSSSLPDITSRSTTSRAPQIQLPLSNAHSSDTAASSSSPLNSLNIPIWSRPKQPEFLSGANLSTNASAALSVVQDAYTGNEESNTSNQPDRETLNTPVSSPAVSQHPRLASVNMANPWATPTHNAPSTLESVSIYDENPWGSSFRSTNTPQKTSIEPTEPTSPLPLDPTVQLPLRRPTAGANYSSRGRNSPNPGQSTNSNTDPLGVGPL